MHRIVCSNTGLFGLAQLSNSSKQFKAKDQPMQSTAKAKHLSQQRVTSQTSSRPFRNLTSPPSPPSPPFLLLLAFSSPLSSHSVVPGFGFARLLPQRPPAEDAAELRPGSRSRSRERRGGARREEDEEDGEGAERTSDGRKNDINKRMQEREERRKGNSRKKKRSDSVSKTHGRMALQLPELVASSLPEEAAFFRKPLSVLSRDIGWKSSCFAATRSRYD